MTELLSRLSRPGAASSGDTGSSSGPGLTGRPLSVNAVAAGVGSALGGLLGFMAIALVGWFLTDNGTHGETTDALRVASVAWLMGHGAHLGWGGVTYTVVPLGLTLIVAAVAFRGGRWASTATRPVDQRELAQSAGLFVSAYVVVAVLVGVLTGSGEAAINLPVVLLGALVVSVLFGGAGLITGAGSWPWVRAQLPVWMWPVVRSALAIVTLLLTASTALVAVSLTLDFGAATTLVDSLDLGGGDVVSLLLVTVLVLPNAILFGAAYLLGPGFSVGVGTAVSPTVAQLGALPAFPLLAALPDNGPTTWVTAASMGVPPILAAVAVALVQRRHPILAWDLAALRGVGSGVAAGVLIALLGGLAGGALGSQRLAQVGPSVPELAVAGALSLGLGGLVGALLMTWWQRRGQAAEAVADPDVADPDVADPDVADPDAADSGTADSDTAPDAVVPAVGTDPADRRDHD